jgi:thiol:disulfide interchange protein
VTLRGVAATGTVTFHPDRVDVEIVPAEGFHLTPIGRVDAVGEPIEVAGKPSAGIEWKAADAPPIDGDVVERYAVRLPYTRAKDDVAVRVGVKWQGCNDEGVCRRAEFFDVVHDAQGARLDVPTPVATAGSTEGRGLLFPSVKAGALTPKGTIVGPAFQPTVKAADESWILSSWKRWGILFLGPIFLAGLLLAFTPCVLPIIPITISIIGGGRTDLPRSRLTFLLTCYALGLSISYGVLGLLAGTGGASFTAAFQHPVALYVIAGIFFLLSLGMFGIYELQPPAWLQRLQGGAKGGSVLGSFAFGALAAVIASPCVGPAIVGMLVFVASEGNHVLGFLMFFTLGLGMSSVFFAAGSFNLLMRPGPWMVWIRWSFGVVMIAAAFYYLASAEKLTPPLLYVVGAVVAAAVAAGTWRHLAHREMDDKAVGKSLALGAVLVLAVVAVGLITRTSGSYWTDVRDRDHFVASVEQAQKDGKVTVVDVWAPWCFYCRRYDDVIEENPGLHAAFGRMNRLRINVDKNDRLDLRDGVGIPANTQPFILFIDEKGVIQRDHDVDRWWKGESATKIEERLKALGVVKPPVAPDGR